MEPRTSPLNLNSKNMLARGAGTSAGKNGGAGRSAGTGAGRPCCLSVHKGASLPAPCARVSNLTQTILPQTGIDWKLDNDSEIAQASRFVRGLLGTGPPDLTLESRLALPSSGIDLASI